MTGVRSKFEFRTYTKKSSILKWSKRWKERYADTSFTSPSPEERQEMSEKGKQRKSQEESRAHVIHVKFKIQVEQNKDNFLKPIYESRRHEMISFSSKRKRFISSLFEGNVRKEI